MHSNLWAGGDVFSVEGQGAKSEGGVFGGCCRFSGNS